jgi:hypothetical protein
MPSKSNSWRPPFYRAQSRSSPKMTSSTQPKHWELISFNHHASRNVRNSCAQKPVKVRRVIGTKAQFCLKYLAEVSIFICQDSRRRGTAKREFRTMLLDQRMAADLSISPSGWWVLSGGRKGIPLWYWVTGRQRIARWHWVGRCGRREVGAGWPETDREVGNGGRPGCALRRPSHCLPSCVGLGTHRRPGDGIWVAGDHDRDEE